jgi:hypothetical protein
MRKMEVWVNINPAIMRQQEQLEDLKRNKQLNKKTLQVQRNRITA